MRIEIDRLSKAFRGGFSALDGVSLSFNSGEMVALIGASGSGKSTLLRHISGLVAGDAAAGHVTVGERTVQHSGRIDRGIRAIRAEVGFVFQQFNLVGRLPVLTNVLSGGLARMPLWRSCFKLFSAEEKARGLDALVRVGIAQHAYKRASALSGGQQQRAAIARTIVQRAKIILADEPIASLDPESARKVMQTLADVREVEYHNTNRLVGAKGWDIGLSKTGYTNEAGRCLIMRIKTAGKNATLVLLNARANSVRVLDALSIRRMISGAAAEGKVRVLGHKRHAAKPGKHRRRAAR